MLKLDLGLGGYLPLSGSLGFYLKELEKSCQFPILKTLFYCPHL